jgi:pimeloyl-ACP methyl ester carboxylesterase
MPSSHYIPLPQGQVHYLMYGAGTRLVLGFHGYGLEAGSFGVLGNALPEGFSLLAFDLPGHGATDWKGGVFDRQMLATLALRAMALFGADKVFLAGYSLGGRVCLTLVEMMPEHVAGVLLMAPDGLVPNRLYAFATQTSLGSSLFNAVLNDPTTFVSLANLFKSLHLINASRHKFVLHYLQTAESRERLRLVWAKLADIVPHLHRLQYALNGRAIPIHLFMGRFDRIIPVAHAEHFKKVFGNVHLHILQKGHRLMDADVATQVAAALMTCTP